MGNIKGSVLTARIKKINPQVAKEMLSTCRRNRRVSMSRVLRLAQAMKLDEWVVAQPIMVNCDGTLIDGQHRMHAVVHCGQPIEFLVIAGYDRESTFARIDDVQTRRLRDWFQIQGEPLPEVMAAVVHLAARDETGRIPTSSGGDFRLTGPEGVAFLESHSKIRNSVVDAPATVNRLVPRSLLSFAHYKFAEKDKVLADSFMIDLITGELEGDGDPIYYLRERLKSNRHSKTRFSRTEMLALIFKAWNAVRHDRMISGLAWRTGGDKPEAFPEVE